MLSAAAFVLCLAQAPPAAASPAPAPAQRPAPAGPVVILETSMGRIKLGLYQDKSPVSVTNFVKYAKGGFYDGTIFHRVIPNFMVQGGGMTPDMKEKATGAPIRNEARNGLRNLRGTVAMARTNDPDSATAQFFVNLKDNAFLDFGIKGAGYAVFGEVLEGMDVVDKIAAVQTTTRGPHSDVPSTAVTITSAKVEGTLNVAPSPRTSPAARPSPGVRRPSPAPRRPPSPRPSPHS